MHTPRTLLIVPALILCGSSIAQSVKVSGVAKIGDGSAVERAYQAYRRRAVAKWKKMGIPASQFPKVTWVVCLASSNVLSGGNMAGSSFRINKDGDQYMLGLKLNVAGEGGKRHDWLTLQPLPTGRLSEVLQGYVKLLKKKGAPLSEAQTQKLHDFYAQTLHGDLVEAWRKTKAKPYDLGAAGILAEKALALYKKNEDLHQHDYYSLYDYLTPKQAAQAYPNGDPRKKIKKQAPTAPAGDQLGGPFSSARTYQPWVDTARVGDYVIRHYRDQHLWERWAVTAVDAKIVTVKITPRYDPKRYPNVKPKPRVEKYRRTSLKEIQDLHAKAKKVGTQSVTIKGRRMSADVIEDAIVHGINSSNGVITKLRTAPCRKVVAKGVPFRGIVLFFTPLDPFGRGKKLGLDYAVVDYGRGRTNTASRKK